MSQSDVRTDAMTGTVRTPRLELVAITAAMLEAERRADGSLGFLLQARLTGEWPPVHWEPHVLEFIDQQIVTQPHAAGWHRYVLLREDGAATLVGCVGGFPKDAGEVEIGYSTLPEFQRRGYATEAVRALIELLMGDAKVRSVCAQTYPSLPESIAVMERCGLTFAGAGDQAGTVRYRRMRV